jgi:hypothetical protein
MIISSAEREVEFAIGYQLCKWLINRQLPAMNLQQ